MFVCAVITINNKKNIEKPEKTHNTTRVFAGLTGNSSGGNDGGAGGFGFVYSTSFAPYNETHRI
jgi:hypothetical protein